MVQALILFKLFHLHLLIVPTEFVFSIVLLAINKFAHTFAEIFFFHAFYLGHKHIVILCWTSSVFSLAIMRTISLLVGVHDSKTFFH